MSQGRPLDVAVIGSGPNGLAAAITFAQQGRSVSVFEAAGTVGGGTRSAELTLPGLTHDVCSAIHPLAAASPFFRNIPLKDHGLELVHPRVPLAHPLDDETAVVLRRSIQETSAGLGGDGPAYRRLMTWMVRDSEKLLDDVLSPLRIPRHPVVMARFGLSAVRSAAGLAASAFRGERARALLAGIAAHSLLPLTKGPTAGYGLLLGLLAHSAGWPMIQGGSQKLADALTSYLQSLGGQVFPGRTIRSFRDLPNARVFVFDLSPRQLVDIAGDRLPASFKSKLNRFKYGPGVFKVDWALKEPIPWTAKECTGAGTVHLGGPMRLIAEGEQAVADGRHPERPFVLMAQPSLFDGTRVSGGKQIAWGYCHVPNGSSQDMTGPIEQQIERFAPGFRDLVLARSTMNAVELQHYNNNYIGGDINGGLANLKQLFLRPTARWVPYSTPNKSIYLCSASTPPGGGVHGMCGYLAAKAALKSSLR